MRNPKNTELEEKCICSDRVLKQRKDGVLTETGATLTSTHLCSVQIQVSDVRCVKTAGNIPVFPVNHDVPEYQPSGLDWPGAIKT